MIGSKTIRRARLLGFGGFIFCWTALPASRAVAYLTFGDLFYGGMNLKWGDPQFGTPATITWGYMADGAGVDPGFRIDPYSYPDTSGVLGGSNISQLRNTVDSQYGAGQFDTAIQNAFNTWSGVANITFVGPVADSGLPVNDPGANTPQIRIGAFMADPNHSFYYGNSVGFAPPPNGGTLEGDILFNLDKPLQIAPGMEDVTPINYFYGNDLEGLILHEIGHALGLAHPPTGLHSTMYVGPGGAEFINRIPSNDDIAGLRRIYGPATIPGDFNLDGQVDGADLAIWQPNFSTTDTGYLDTGDADNDGDVDGADFVIWQTHASANALPATSTVPEPASVVLAAIAVFCLPLALSHRIKNRALGNTESGL